MQGHKVAENMRRLNAVGAFTYSMLHIIYRLLLSSSLILITSLVVMFLFMGEQQLASTYSVLNNATIYEIKDVLATFFGVIVLLVSQIYFARAVFIYSEHRYMQEFKLKSLVNVLATMILITIAITSTLLYNDFSSGVLRTAEISFEHLKQYIIIATTVSLSALALIGVALLSSQTPFNSGKRGVEIKSTNESLKHG